MQCIKPKAVSEENRNLQTAARYQKSTMARESSNVFPGCVIFFAETFGNGILIESGDEL